MSGPVAGGAEQFETMLASFVRENRLYGAAAGVVHGAELAWSSGVGFADRASGRRSGPDVLYRIASITKTFTGTAILQLRDAGKLDLDDPVVKWVPELADSASPATIGTVTIRRLLSHESGLVSEPPGADFMALPPSYQGVAARNLERVGEIFIAVPPNTQVKYCNLGYQLLGEIVTRVGEIPYAQYVVERILTPLRMSSTGFEPFDPALAQRRAVGYSGRAFSDELAVAPSMPPVWAEGGLWSTIADIGRWLSFQLAAHPRLPASETEVADSPVLSAATRREMHKPRYLSDEEWSSAWGVSWYSVRKDDVTWVQHSGGLPGYSSNACFDRATGVGAIVLVNGSADASALAMAIGAKARELADAAPPRFAPPAQMPAVLRPLLGLYAPADMSFLLRIEWRDGKLAAVGDEPAEVMPLEQGSNADSFVVTPGFRQSGEPLVFHRRADGSVSSLLMGGGSLVRLDAVTSAGG
jgi:CubicO group peptidase (beta-lactamase class C family)